MVGLSTAAWALILLVRGVSLEPEWITSYGLAVTLVTFIVLLADRFFWRLGPLCRLIPNRPVIHGTWKGVVASSKQDVPIPGFLVISQTLRKVSVSLLTERGRSHTITSIWERTEHGDPAVHYTFRRFPSANAADQQAIRFGSGVLEVCDKSAKRIVGPYWTEVKTTGDVDFNWTTRKTFSTFDDAVQQIGEP